MSAREDVLYGFTAAARVAKPESPRLRFVRTVAQRAHAYFLVAVLRIGLVMLQHEFLKLVRFVGVEIAQPLAEFVHVLGLYTLIKAVANEAVGDESRTAEFTHVARPMAPMALALAFSLCIEAPNALSPEDATIWRCFFWPVVHMRLLHAALLSLLLLDERLRSGRLLRSDDLSIIHGDVKGGAGSLVHLKEFCALLDQIRVFLVDLTQVGSGLLFRGLCISNHYVDAGKGDSVFVHRFPFILWVAEVFFPLGKKPRLGLSNSMKKKKNLFLSHILIESVAKLKWPPESNDG